MKYVFAIAALFSAASAGAVSFNSVAGAPDPGPAAGQNLVLTFDNPNPAGWTWSAGNIATSAVNMPGVAAMPAVGVGGTPSAFGYVSSALTPNFATLSFATALRNVSLYWGSIDNYNFVDVLGPGGSVLATIGGGMLPPANGDQGSGITNRRVFINGDGASITGLTFRSTGVAFEFDTIAGQAVPEPASWAMLIAGMGLVGLMSRRRHVTVSA